MSTTATQPSPAPLLPRTIPATRENAKLLVEAAIRIVHRDLDARTDVDPEAMEASIEAARHLAHALHAINQMGQEICYTPMRSRR